MSSTFFASPATLSLSESASSSTRMASKPPGGGLSRIASTARISASWGSLPHFLSKNRQMCTQQPITRPY